MRIAVKTAVSMTVVADAGSGGGEDGREGPKLYFKRKMVSAFLIVNCAGNDHCQQRRWYNKNMCNVTQCFFETPSSLGEKWQSNKFFFSIRVKHETKANIKMKDERITNPYSDIKANMP